MAGYQSDGDVEQVYALGFTWNNDLLIPPYLTAAADFGRALLLLCLWSSPGIFLPREMYLQTFFFLFFCYKRGRRFKFKIAVKNGRERAGRTSRRTFLSELLLRSNHPLFGDRYKKSLQYQHHTLPNPHPLSVTPNLFSG